MSDPILHSDRFTEEFDDRKDFDSLDSIAEIFEIFSSKPLTLEDILKEAKFENRLGEIKDRFESVKTNNKESYRYAERWGITDDELGAIYCYTLEKKGKEKAPYKIINESLASSRDRKNLFSTGKFIYLLLKGLRKLPRFRPQGGRGLYRGLNTKVPLTEKEAKGHQFYESEKNVKWWGFTSTSKQFGVATKTFGKTPENTIFMIGGDNLWGYEISLLSSFRSEEEVILEPETNIKVIETVNFRGSLFIRVEAQKRAKLVLEDLIPPRNDMEINYILEMDEPESRPGENLFREHPDKEINTRLATKVNGEWCTVFGSTPLPRNTVFLWNTRIIKSQHNDGRDIYVGVVPSDIDQSNIDNLFSCGWFFSCYDSTLYSGAPHNYKGRKYGPRKKDGQYVHTGDRIGVVMDTAKGDLSFVVNGVNLGVAFEEIPHDKELSIFFFFKNEGDSVELDTSSAKENVNSSIPVPSNLTTKRNTWNSITITWDAVEGASFYQVRIDNSIHEFITTNTFTKSGLFENIDHVFKVRVVKENEVGKWSEAKREERQNQNEKSVWRECPGNAGEKRYSIDAINKKIITSTTEKLCTAIKHEVLPRNKVSSWNINILKSQENDGNDIYIGVAPFDINQNEEDNSDKCGWYFHCGDSKLYSGPPHYYEDKKYGLRKEEGQYVHTGDSVGVVMDTTQGELSFVLSGVNLGVAFNGIPFDKPLVPCVILGWQGDSVGLDTSGVKEIIDSSLPILSNITTESNTLDSISLTWDAVEGASFYQIEVDGNKSWDASTTNTFTKKGFLPDTEHTFRVRAVKRNGAGKWSNAVKGKTQKNFANCAWKKCPNDAGSMLKYSINKKNPRIASKTFSKIDYYATIIGDINILPRKVTSWSINITDSEKNDGNGIIIGVAPSKISQNICNCNNCGWYFNCYKSTLHSGPPHNYRGKEYGSRKENGQYVHIGDSVGVVMDTTKGELSFVVNGVNLGAAYEGIPLDKPLVPCVLLCYEDSIELDTSEVKENVDNSIPVPSKITTKSDTWDSITLTWDAVEGASTYQIEIDDIILSNMASTNIFTKRGLLPETEHTFRVRVVRGDSVGKWSGTVKGRTERGLFEDSRWKECPDGIRESSEYSVDEKTLKIASRILDEQALGRRSWSNLSSTVIGSTLLPPSKVTSWSIKILKSRNNDGDCIYVGVAPFDIDQNEENNHIKCGWYFYCRDSTLFSGPPHKHNGKEHGPRKGYGQYVHTGDSIGVVMDTTKGELSFVVDGVNLGIAYGRIPLDKPLVPCVLFGHEDSIEIDTSEVKENVDSSIPPPSNITEKSITWDSITLIWDDVEGASFYQIEMDGSKFWEISTTNKFTKRGLLPDTEHSFRIRSVKGNSVSEWSNVVKGRTQKAPDFSKCVWNKCPDDINEFRKYSVNRSNKIVRCTGSNGCAVTGNAPLPLNKVSSWEIEIIDSFNNGQGIFIGVAPSDVNQNERANYNYCGWYLNCYASVLFSGPPHYYKFKEYGPRKGDGNYVHKEDTVGVVMNTAKGDLSFVVNGVDLGVAYEGIPLDKPLVPCVFLEGSRDDSVELII